MRVPRSTRPLLVLRDSTDVAGVWALGALVMFAVSAAGAGALDLWLHQTLEVTWLDGICGLLLAIVAHEALHAAAIVAARGRPQALFGVRDSLPYLHLASRRRLTRNGGLITMLAPFSVVDVLGLVLLAIPATAGIGLIVVVANSIGSIPDLWRAIQLARLPAWVQCEERGPTTQVWAPSDRNREASLLDADAATAPPAVIGVLGTWIVCVLVGEAVCAGGVRLLAQWTGTVRVAGALLASTEQFVSGPDVILNLWPLLGLGAVLGTLATATWVGLTTTLRRRRPGVARRPAA